MLDPRIVAALRRAARSLDRPGADVTDAALLDRLARDRDHAAFAELLARHGSAVWGVCRRLTRTEQDAEDVFQATFLVLARDTARVRKAASVGSWLHGVAARIGHKTRAKASRTPDPARLRSPATAPDPIASLSWQEVQTALHAELARLPDRLRAPILLCYFRGMTQDEAAAELGWSARRVKARVARGRELLRARLTRRGVELPAALSVPLLSAELASAVPARLLVGLTDPAHGWPHGPEVSPAVAALARTEVPVMTLSRLVVGGAAASLLAAGAMVGLAVGPPAPAAAPEAPARGAAAPAPGTLRIGTTQFRLQSHRHEKAFYTADGKTVIVTTMGGRTEFWNPETGQRTGELPVPKSQFADADFAPSRHLLAVIGRAIPDEPTRGAETAIWLIDTATRQIVRTLRPSDLGVGGLNRVLFAPDGKRFVTATADEIRVWDVKTGDELIRQKQRSGVSALAISPDGKTVAFGRYDLFLWDWSSGAEPRKFARVGGSGAELIAFAADGKTLYATRSGGRVVTLDTATGRPTGTFDSGITPRNWSISPDGRTLAVVFYDTSRAHDLSNHVLLWDLIAGKERARLSTGELNANHVNWSADGSRLVAITDYRLWAWDAKTGKPLGPSAPGHEGTITAFAFAPDGRLFTASDDHTVRSWDAATGAPGLTLMHDGWVRDVALSPDGSRVAGSALRNDLRVWDAKTGREQFRLLGNGMMGGQRKVRFTPDGSRLIAWGDDLYLRVWDVRNGKLLAEHRTLPDGVTDESLENDQLRVQMLGFLSADISADGSAFAFSQFKTVRLYDVKTGRERVTFEGDPNGVVALALSPDGKRLALAGRGEATRTRLADGRTRYSTAHVHELAVWDVAAKKPVWRVRAAGTWPSAVAFSPDGARLAELSSDDPTPNVIRLWDAATGADVGRIDLPRPCNRFAFDRAGRRIAVANMDTTALVYDLQTALRPSTTK